MNTFTPAITARCQHAPILSKLGTFARTQGVALYLVGGSVRDLLLNRPTADLDFTLASDAMPFAKAFAAHIGGTFVRLDERPPTARVVLKTQQLSLDFAQFRAASLIEDLRRRDLTINAMAVPLEAILDDARVESAPTGHLGDDARVESAPTGYPGDEARLESAPTGNNCNVNGVRGNVPRESAALIDPGGGIADLTAHHLRFLSEQVVRDDALRLVRIYRFAAQLGFEITPDSIALIQKHHSLLPRVAAERIRDEFMKILKVEKAHPYLQEMWKVGVLAHIVPIADASPLSPNHVARAPVPRHPWRALQTFEAGPVCVHQTEIDAYLKTELEWEVNRRSLIKLCLLLRGELGDVVKRLRLSRKSAQFLKCIAATHRLLTTEQLTQQDIIRFLRRTASDWLGVLLFASALHGLTDARIRQIVDTYSQHFLPILKQGRLLTGEDLIQRFDLKEGRQIGVLLKQIEERQFSGEIRTREEAFAVVAALITKRTP